MRAKELNKFFDKYMPLALRKNRNDKKEIKYDDIDIINFFDHSGITLLHRAVSDRNSAMTTFLIKKGCQIDAMDNSGNTPLMIAVQYWNEVIMRVLLKNNAHMLIRNYNSECPLVCVLNYSGFRDKIISMMFLKAVKKKYSNDTAKILLEFQCPISRALLLESVTITKYMLDNGSSVNDRDVNNDTALHYAVRCMDLRNVKLLVERGADVNAVNSSLQTPLDMYDFKRKENKKILRILLDNGASLLAYDGGDSIVAGKFLRYGSAKLVKILLDYELDFQMVNSDGKTLLHHVVINENDGVFELIQSTNFNYNVMDRDGCYAIAYAIENANSLGLEFLLRNGNRENIDDGINLIQFIMQMSSTLFNKEFDEKKNFSDCLRLLLLYDSTIELDDLNLLLPRGIPTTDDIGVQKLVIEHSVIAEIQDKLTGKFDITNGDEYLENYLYFCKHDIAIMVCTEIYEDITMFDLLTVEIEKLEKYVRNDDLMDNFYRIFDEEFEEIFDSNISQFLRDRVEIALQISKLRQQAINFLMTFSDGCKNFYIANNIVSYLDRRDLCTIALLDF